MVREQRIARKSAASGSPKRFSDARITPARPRSGVPLDQRALYSPRRMRSHGLSFVLALLLWPSGARAADPDPALALFAGAGIQLAGFIAGGSLLATSHSDSAQNDAGWLAIESSFTLAPFIAHGVVDEWGRGAVFAVIPGGALATTAGLFASDPGAVERGGLPEQRWMWGLFGVGLLASAAGVIDAVLAPLRAHPVSVDPVVGAGQLGLRIGGRW